MAAGRETISLSFQAELGDLKRQLSTLPGVTKREAAQMVRELNTGFKQAERAAARAAKANKRQFRQMADSAQMAAAAIAGAAASVVALSQAFADLQNELLDASARTGVAVETLAGLRLAAEGSGLEFRNLEAGLNRLPKSMADAARGTGAAARAFDALGVAVVDTEGELRSSEDVLQETFEALSAIENPAEKAALAIDLLGQRAGPAFIQSGAIDNLDAFVSLATEFGVDVGPKAAEQAAQFQRSIALLKTAGIGELQDLVDAIGGEGGMSDVLEAATVAVVFLGNVFAGVLAEISENVGRIIDGPIRALAMALNGEPVEAARIFADTIDDTLIGLASGMTGYTLAKGLAEGYEDAIEAVDSLRAKTAALQGGAPQRVIGAPGSEAASPSAAAPLVAAGTEATDAAIRDLERLRAAQRKASEARLSERAKIELAYIRETQIIEAAFDADADREELRAAMAAADGERLIALAALEEKLHDEKMERMRQEAEEAARLTQMTVSATADAMGALAGLAGTAATAMAEAGTAGARKNAQVLFGVSKALATAMIPLRLAEALMTAAAQPPPINGIMAATAIATAGAQGIAIASAKPPTFDRGGIIHAGTGDQVAAAVLPGEAILSREAVAGIGAQGVEDLNSGRGMRQPMVVQMVYRHRVFDEFVQDNISAPTPLGSALRGDSVTGRRS